MALQAITKAIDFVLLVEPIWVLVATGVVFVSYLADLGYGMPWIGLSMAATPLLLRTMRRQPPRLNTELDLPMAMIAVSALVGLSVSPNKTISLGCFQCIIAITLLYYSWTSSVHIPLLTKWVVRIVPPLILIVLIIGIGLPSPSTQPGFTVWGTGTHHGLAMVLLITVIILLGIAVLGRDHRARVVAAVISLCLFAITLTLTWDSLRSLLLWDSIEARMPIWEDTVSMLADSPITGLGLGCWAFSYYGTAAAIPEPTHAHNAYLELYANTGLLGALALVVALVVGAKLAWAIIRSPRNHPWYGFGVGVVMACVATLLVGLVESAPVGVPLVAEDTYYYLISPVPWILAGLLVSAHKLLKIEVKG